VPIPVDVLVEIVPAALVSGAILLFTWRWREQAWRAPVAVGAGFAATFVYALGLPGWMPVDTTRLLLHFAVAAAVFGAVDARLPRPLAWALRLVFSAAVPWLLLRGLPEPPVTSMIVAGAALFATWMALDWRARAVDGWAQPLAILITAGAGGQALAAAGTGLIGQLSGALAAATGPLLVFGLLHEKQTLARGGAGAVAVLAGALWMCGHFFAELPLSSACLLMAAPLAATRKRWWAGALVAAILAGLAVYLSMHANPAGPSSPYDEYFD
jgi:hypothetical protein